jgi:outer membrane protein assembly factor BamB
MEFFFLEGIPIMNAAAPPKPTLLNRRSIGCLLIPCFVFFGPGFAEPANSIAAAELLRDQPVSEGLELGDLVGRSRPVFPLGEQAVPTRATSDSAAEHGQAAAEPKIPARKATDWAQWRGPGRNGLSGETRLLSEWPSAGPAVAWQIGGLGNGFSSVAISNGRLFTMGKFGEDTNLVARDAKTGQRLWETWIGKGGDAPNSTPTVDGDLVFALSFQGDLLCADARSGRMIWRINLQEDLGGTMMSQWGYSESVLVDGDRLIVTPGAPDAAMVALNKKTGQVIWRAMLPPNPGPAGKDGAGYSSVVISEARGVKQYVQLIGRGLIGVDANNGNLLWIYNRIANSTANVPTPIVSGDLIFCSSGYDEGGSALLEIRGSKPRINVHEVYYKPARELQNHHGGMVLIGDQIYMGHGHNNGFPVCFDLKTGKDRWRPGRGAGTGSAAVLYADGHLYFRYENGIMALIEATPEAYRLKGKFRIAINNGQSWSHPVVYDGKLFLRDQQELICYDIRK